RPRPPRSSLQSSPAQRALRRGRESLLPLALRDPAEARRARRFRARERLPHQSRAARGRRPPAARRHPVLMRVVMLAPELHPYAKTGGLADVMAALPSALARRGVETTVCL